ncbi:uncharacterized protein LOC131944246 [Physella acuta]|uniref:uncharacterized protein LOC131944246 n=1 Tax=Physella acuta TaxID=109671 RepID=UPI0027DD6B7D|nr:uncharacterized protein LOC131944246 [Physella acuta]
MDTDSEECEDIELLSKALEDAMISNPEGYHAFLVVVKFGNRFTKEEQKAIQLFKGILGEDFLKNYGIIVMCNGDNFKREASKNNMTVETYCNSQMGLFRSLLDDCNNRIVLFNNVTEDEYEKYQQVKNLVNAVDQLQNSGRRYTNDSFKKVEDKRKHMMVTSNINVIEKDILIKQRVILDNMKNIQEYSKSDEIQKIEKLQKLMPQIDELIQDLQTKDRGTGALHKLFENVKEARKNLSDTIEFNKTVVKNREESKAREEAIKKEAEEKKRKAKLKLEQEMIEKQKELEEQLKQLNDLKEKERAKMKEEMDAKLKDKLEKEKKKIEQKAADDLKTMEAEIIKRYHISQQ